ncbi:glycerophosphoryl diester phosphodiesterase [Agrobacterium vitis]|uniref:Glycerophosphoryl diester phosphodiesterase n=2 Tax=Agrobacterium TaxID=357 RepID=A0A2Z2PXI5_AGRTU|nr:MULTISPECIES: glycerophosphodiester phosphodiesterase family protein [Rhizobium/Agrobacterium group]MCF1501893.1 glycerophosphoryl diester phosphodiesterase [Allorhizobium sp. Av2]ASK46901.1 glycerophosphoryl diester phosphodiesterase [Agrobacterium radiobacter]KAA3505380.1 glycerophosphoryl diester phosphodiesterase [Agrobacterium vitis]KAA3519300.1 glycerophosphoryl diester phosphodiesterase [Agrobacterium vitis]MBF2712696.1 glycerophosphoryl diester phosphodiesterase [Agrobacterium vitis
MSQSSALKRATDTGRHFVVPEPIIAHRGAPRLAPENTLAGIRAAVEKGARWVEVDVKLTRDQKPIIIHDDTVDRTTNGKGFVAGMTFEEIRRLDARASFGEEFSGIQVPTLEELIETVLDLDVGLQLELKPTPGDDIETAEIALNVLKALWPKDRERLFVGSFSIRSIHAAARILPDVPRAYFVCIPPKDPVALLNETKCQLLHVTKDVLDDEAMKVLADSGIEFAVSVVNDPPVARRLLNLGAQTISTDIPDLLDAH